MKQEVTVPNTPQQNGVAERYNRVITEMTQGLLGKAKLPKMFWVRTMSTAVRVRNLSPTSSNEKSLSPTEMHYGKLSKVSYLIACCTIWTEATDGNWLHRASKASSSATTRRAKTTC